MAVSRRVLAAVSRPEDLDVAALTAAVMRAFGPSHRYELERTPQGTSTPVYRLVRGDEVFYVRAAEHRDHPLDVEVEVHRRLRALGVRVPEVVYHESLDPQLGRGVAILTALPGTSVASVAPLPGTALAEVYRAAGRDLARIESIPVEGFGFLSRDVRQDQHRDEHRGSAGPAVWPLRAPHRTGSGALRAVPEGRDGADGVAPERLLGDAASSQRARALERVLADADHLFGDDRSAVLVHGDVDPAHVFHLEGRYTGLIDLGELRGATPGDDLARFRLWVGEGAALTNLTAGYAELAGLPDDHDHRGRALAALLGVQQLGRWHVRGGDAELARPTARRLAARIGDLLDQLA